jgi:hypothetical protein
LGREKTKDIIVEVFSVLYCSGTFCSTKWLVWRLHRPAGLCRVLRNEDILTWKYCICTYISCLWSYPHALQWNTAIMPSRNAPSLFASYSASLHAVS